MIIDIELRRFATDDVETLTNIFADWPTVQFTRLPHPVETDRVRSWLEEIERCEREGLMLHRACVSERGDVLGGIGVHALSSELGFWVDRRRWGQRIGPRMLEAFLPLCGALTGLEYVLCAVHPQNQRSIRLLERCRFTSIGSHPYEFDHDLLVKTAEFFARRL
jgi:8-oxo-dGTP diphosphatase